MLIDHGQSMTVLEIKLSRSVTPEHAKGLLRLPSSIPIGSRYLVSMTPDEFEIVRGVRAVPWWKPPAV